jgi:hypothetical protein
MSPSNRTHTISTLLTATMLGTSSRIGSFSEDSRAHDVKRIRRLAVLKRDIGIREEHGLKVAVGWRSQLFKDRCDIGVR